MENKEPKRIPTGTTINVRGGGTYRRETIIDSSTFSPARAGLRYKLAPWTLGKLERLAKARFHITELTNENLKDWKHLDPEANRILAQSVNASSEIEGEAVAVDKLSILEAPVTDPVVGRVNGELDSRMEAIRSIYEAYLWMLCRDSTPIISPAIIQECHERMFKTTKGEKAGCLKTRPVIIEGGGYHIETLSPEKTEECLKAICDQFNKKWELSIQHAEHSRFLLIAEFVLDFLAIHPFEDGNGRTARLLSTYLLEKAGYHFARFYSVDSVVLEQRTEYYNALYQGQKNWHQKEEDLSTWIEFYVNIIFTQWTRAYERVKDEFLKKTR